METLTRVATRGCAAASPGTQSLMESAVSISIYIQSKTMNVSFTNGSHLAQSKIFSKHSNLISRQKKP